MSYESRFNDFCQQRLPIVTNILQLTLFIFCVATAKLVTKLFIFEVSRAQTVRHTHKPVRTSLDEWSANSRQQTQQTKNYTFTEIRNRYSSKQAASDLRLRLQGYRYQMYQYLVSYMGVTFVDRRSPNQLDDQDSCEGPRKSFMF